MRAVRLTLMAIYLVVYLWWLRNRGLPIDRISVGISLAIFLVCAFIGRSLRTWAVLLLDVVLYCVMWFCYEMTRGAADHLGMPLQVESTRNIDRFLFIGHDPNVVLQEHFWEPHGPLVRLGGVVELHDPLHLAGHRDGRAVGHHAPPVGAVHEAVRHGTRRVSACCSCCCPRRRRGWCRRSRTS